MPKLVRNLIPKIIDTNGRGEKSRWHRIDNDQEFRGALLDKLFEEAREVMGAITPEARLVECADVVEVIFTLLALQGVTKREFVRVLNAQREERGGFEERVFLEGVDIPIPRNIFTK